MKFGVADYGMNVWEGGCFDLQTRLEELKGIGFDGIERLEFVDGADALAKAVLYRRLGMDFATCRGPNAETTLRFSAALGMNKADLGGLLDSVDIPRTARIEQLTMDQLLAVYKASR